ncbi:hypothetical protein CEXT_694371 [Caerostris extrusa]|uniref:Uncharacterized protein n=1 Tax=Caerostris extrusa TaxID=172846 RepID=A0AAV4Y371_CAEEX|nr:hypothetical protein CEXT_694371 [Caerostris extrusa]
MNEIRSLEKKELNSPSPPRNKYSTAVSSHISISTPSTEQQNRISDESFNASYSAREKRKINQRGKFFHGNRTGVINGHCHVTRVCSVRECALKCVFFDDSIKPFNALHYDSVKEL